MRPDILGQDRPCYGSCPHLLGNRGLTNVMNMLAAVPVVVDMTEAVEAVSVVVEGGIRISIQGISFSVPSKTAFSKSILESRSKSDARLFNAASSSSPILNSRCLSLSFLEGIRMAIRRVNVQLLFPEFDDSNY